MRALLTGDFRFNPQWFAWLIASADAYDLIIFGGDILDTQSRIGLSKQIVRASAILRTVANKRPTVICSGNHDAVDQPAHTAAGVRPSWLDLLANASRMASDGQSFVFANRLTVTVLGYLTDLPQKRTQLREGKQLREASNTRWLVVHHHPPGFSANVGPEECAAGQLLEEFSPTVWCSARYFRQPYRRGFCGQEKIGNTIVINLAQARLDGTRSTGPVPNHVTWNLESNQLSWSDFRAVPDELLRCR